MCTLAEQYEDGRLKMLPSMENTRENWLHLRKTLPAEAELAVEVSTSGHFVMSAVEEAGWRESDLCQKTRFRRFCFHRRLEA
jgi:hypothetical protein